MQENILEHTTSIAGLTYKPLAILSETISPQEMSRAQGGNGCGEKKKEEEKDPIDWNDRPGASDFISSHLGRPPGEPLPPPPPIGGSQGPQTSPADWYNQGEPADAYLYGLTDDPSSADPFDENFNQNEVIDQQDSTTQAESGYYPEEGDCGEGEGEGEDDSSWLDDIWDWLTGDEDDEDDDSSGLDGMEGDFDLSENEIFT